MMNGITTVEETKMILEPPMFSIITVVLNDLDALKLTYKSIFGLCAISFEWIVCDGDSGEETTILLESLGDRVKWISMKDKGIYDAMNLGVSMSTGNYVVFMNAGDTFYSSETLAKVARVLRARKQDVDVLFGGAMLSFSDKNRLFYRAPRKVEVSLWHGLPANHQATYYRRTLLERNPYDLQYSLCGDYYLAAKLMKSGATAEYLDEPLAIFEVGGASYKKSKQLFLDPYRIQRDILNQPIRLRMSSMLKRLVSTLGFILLSHFNFNKLVMCVHGFNRSAYIRTKEKDNVNE